MRKYWLLIICCSLLAGCKTTEDRAVVRAKTKSSVSEVKHWAELVSGKPVSTCSFRVTTPEHGTHSYRVANRFGHKREYDKCMTIKNGDPITVAKLATVRVEIDGTKVTEISTLAEWYQWEHGTIAGRFNNTLQK